jgi:hypothetical protein
LTEALNNFPRSITVQGQQTVNVVINGAEAFAKLEPAVRELVISQTTSQIQKAFKEHLPDAGVPLT